MINFLLVVVFVEFYFCEAQASLPREMSSRFRVCSNIASAITKLGYQDELGFQAFLYPNEKVNKVKFNAVFSATQMNIHQETRKLLMFLVEKLPRTDAADADELIGSNNTLKSISAALSGLKV